MPLEDLLTLPLQVARDLSQQPDQPVADSVEYDTTQQQNQQQDSFQRDLPQFFRDTFQQLNQYQQVRQAQETVFAQNQAAQQEQIQQAQSQEAQMIPPPMTDQDIPQMTGQKTIALPPTAPQVQPTPSPIIQKHGGWFSKLVDIVQTPGRLVNTPIAAVEHQVNKAIGAAMPDIIERHIPSFIKDSAKLTEDILGAKTATPQEAWKTLREVNDQAIVPIQTRLQQADRAVAAHTVDPLIEHAPMSPTMKKILLPIEHFGFDMAPYIAVALLTGGVGAAAAAPGEAGAAFGVGFGAANTVLWRTALASQGVSLGSTYQAYKNGQITGRQFLDTAGKTIAMNAAMIIGPKIGGKAVELLRTAAQKDLPTFTGAVDAGSKAIDTTLEKAPETIPVYHGTGKPLEGPLKKGSFVTTDRNAAETYANVDARIRQAQGEEGTAPTVHEFRVNKEDLGEAPANATNLGSPFITRRELPLEAPKEAAPAAPGEPALKVVQQNASAAIIQRPDGTYDVYDKRYANLPGTSHEGVMAGANPAEAIRNFKTADEALNHAEDLAVRPNALAAQGRAAFHEDMGQKLEEAQAVQEAGQITSPVIRQAEEVAAKAEIPERSMMTEQEAIKAYENNLLIQRQANKVSAHTQADETRFRGLVDDTNMKQGTTVNVDTGKSVPNEGYFVGGSGAKTLTVPLEDFTPQVAAQFVRDNAKAFDVPNTHLGTEVVTVDGKKMVNIDASTQTMDRETALGLAKNRGEQRIWSAADKGYIEVPGVKQRQIPITKKVELPKENEIQIRNDVHWLNKELTKKALQPGETRGQRFQRLKDDATTQWNNRLAASEFLNTGEMPKSIISPEVRTVVEQQAQQYRQDFRERTELVDSKMLAKMGKKENIPIWQKTEIDNAIARRQAPQEEVVKRVKELPKETQTRLEQLGFASHPLPVTEVTALQSVFDELRGIKTLDKLTQWLNKNNAISGDPQQYIGRKPYSKYWEPKSSTDTTRILNIGKIKSEILTRFPDQRAIDGTSRNGADTLGLKKNEPFGPCAGA